MSVSEGSRPSLVERARSEARALSSAGSRTSTATIGHHSGAPKDPFAEDPRHGGGVIPIQLVEAFRETRRRAHRTSTVGQPSMTREEFIKKIGIDYEDTIDPTNGVSCIGVTDAEMAYYGHPEDFAFAAYRLSLSHMVEDIAWLKNENFVADKVQYDVGAFHILWSELRRVHASERYNDIMSPDGGVGDLNTLLIESAARGRNPAAPAQPKRYEATVRHTQASDYTTAPSGDEQSKEEGALVVASGEQRGGTALVSAATTPAKQDSSLVSRENNNNNNNNSSSTPTACSSTIADAISPARLKMIAEFRTASPRRLHLLPGDGGECYSEGEGGLQFAGCGETEPVEKPKLQYSRKAKNYKADLLVAYRERKESGKTSSSQQGRIGSPGRRSSSRSRDEF